MENASKALLMAAGVLIAIVTISALVLIYNRTTEISKLEQDKLIAEQLVEFNMEYESYNRKDLYGTQIISIMNKMLDNNEKYSRLEEPNYTMTMVVKFTVPDEYFNTSTKGTTEYYLVKPTDENGLPKLTKTQEKLLTEKVPVEEVRVNNNSENVTELKRKLFKCTGIEYNKETGRVNCMSFEEINPTDDEYKII